MMDDRVIKQATEDVLEELNLAEWRFEIEPALAAPNGADARQIRLFDTEGKDRGASVVNFQDAEGNVSHYINDIKEKISRQLETLVKISG